MNILSPQVSLPSNLSNFAIGFDDMFDTLRDWETPNNNFPPYNIIKDNNVFLIEMALAGFQRKDVKISAEGSTLKVVATYADDLPKDADYLHRGISRKSVHREFALADEIKVIGAQMDSGMLTIRLEKVIPEHKKPKLIEVK